MWSSVRNSSGYPISPRKWADQKPKRLEHGDYDEPDRRLPRSRRCGCARRRQPSPEAEVSETAASIAKLDPPVCTVRILGQCLLSKGREDEAEAAKAKAAEPEGAAGKTDTANAKTDGGEETLSADEQPRPAEPEGAAGKTDTANAERPMGGGGKRLPPSNSLRPRRRTKPTICSSPRRMSFARSKQPRKQPRLKERPATPRRTQIPRRPTLKQGLRP